jgi:hypothetical protein
MTRKRARSVEVSASHLTLRPRDWDRAMGAGLAEMHRIVSPGGIVPVRLHAEFGAREYDVILAAAQQVGLRYVSTLFFDRDGVLGSMWTLPHGHEWERLGATGTALAVFAKDAPGQRPGTAEEMDRILRAARNGEFTASDVVRVGPEPR